MLRTPFFITTDGIDSFSTLIAELSELEQKLPAERLAQFVPFNIAYMRITQDIMAAAEEDYFKNPQFIEDFTVYFACLYFEAVNQTVGDDVHLPTAWKLMNEAGSDKNTPASILLLMGANAHINRDLPLAMIEKIKEEQPKNFLADVRRVDRLLMKSGREIVKAFDESNHTLNSLKKRLVFLYYRPVMYVILYWRIKAWRSFAKIKKVGREKSNYEDTSIKIAQRFRRLAAHFAHRNT